MWPRRSDALCVGLSQAQVDWQFAGRSAQSAELPVPGAQFEQVAVMIEAAARPLRFSAVHVVAGSSLARHWLQTAPRGLRSLSELQALVQSRADQLFGGDPGWVVAADWHATRPFLCAALPREVARLADVVASTQRANAHAATSLCLALARHAKNLPADGWVVLHEPEALHLLYLSAGELEYVRTAMVPMGLQALALERQSATEVERSSALAGGLATSPLTILSMSTDPGASQSSVALHLATRAYGGPHEAAAHRV